METKRQLVKTEHTIHPDLTKEQIQLKQERKTMTNTTKFRSNLLFSLSLGAEKETTSHLSIISHKLNKEFDREEISTATTFNFWTEPMEKNINTNKVTIIHLNNREVSILYDLTRHDTGKTKLFLVPPSDGHTH